MNSVDMRAAGRPARLPRSARRKQLLGAAQEVFVAQGYHAAAMDDIAERAGVSKPVLYQHFPGKLELYLALLDTHCDAIIEGVRAAMRVTEENRGRVHAAVAAYFDFVDHDSGAFRLVFASDLRHETAVRDRIKRVERECTHAVADEITTTTGTARPSAELLACGLVGAAVHAAQYWLGGGRAVPKAQAVELLAALAWRGIASFPPQEGADGPGSPPLVAADATTAPAPGGAAPQPAGAALPPGEVDGAVPPRDGVSGTAEAG